jgi:hypothetical protein
MRGRATLSGDERKILIADTTVSAVRAWFTTRDPYAQLVGGVSGVRDRSKLDEIECFARELKVDGLLILIADLDSS